MRTAVGRFTHRAKLGRSVLRPYFFQVLGKRLRGLLKSKYPAYAENYAKCIKREAEPHGRRLQDGSARG
jgi:hypothetical protein